MAFLLVFFVLSVSTCFLFERTFDPCGNEELQTILSPAAKRKAVIFQRDCGATTRFSTQVSVLSASSGLPREAGNTLTADTDHGQAPSGPGGGPMVTVQWTAELELLVKYDKRARVFRSEQSVDGVTIIYDPQ